MQLSQGSKWIWAKNCPYEVNCYCEFADKFIVERPDSTVQVRISADSQYALWINGRFADFGQYADFPEYKIFAESCGAECIAIPCREDDFAPARQCRR